MSGTSTPGDPDRELQQEILLTIRAERRLREHELTHRRALLALTVALPIAGVVLAFLGEPYVGGASVLGGLASGVSALSKASARR